VKAKRNPPKTEGGNGGGRRIGGKTRVLLHELTLDRWPHRGVQSWRVVTHWKKEKRSPGLGPPGKKGTKRGGDCSEKRGRDK